MLATVLREVVLLIGEGEAALVWVVGFLVVGFLVVDFLEVGFLAVDLFAATFSADFFLEGLLLAMELA
ncbi:MAG: hypothetical protein KDA72_10310 [Planctomycetales bacterium]|nr:hypothetical protein [Planctomycetales bacterium]